MKILLVNQVFYPDLVATAQHTYDLAQYLTRKGCEVSVVCGARGYEYRKRVFPSYEEHKGIKIYRVQSTGLGKHRFFFRVIDSVTLEFLMFWKLLTVPKADVTIGFTSPPLIGFIGVIACLLRRGKYVNWLMDLNPDAAIAVGYLREKSLIARLLRKAFQFSLVKSEHCVVLDRWMKEKIASYGMAPERISVVRPWPVHEVNPATALKPPCENHFRKTYGLVDKFIVLYSGNHSVVHPLDTVLEAALKLRDDPKVQFVFVGGGLRTEDVAAFKVKHDLSNILQLEHQPRELLDESLSMANLHLVVMGNAVNGLVHTSKIYGILATGTPYVAVAPTRSHLADLLADCPYGYHVEHGDVAGLIDVISRARGLSPDELARFRRENVAWVKANGSPEYLMDQFAHEVLKLPATHAPKVAAR